MAHPLVQELVNLLGQRDNLNPAFDQWRQRCARELRNLPADQRSALVTQLQEILTENRALFEQESQAIFDTLVEAPPSPRKKAQAKRYRTIGDL